jgi:hypothetical protein
MSSSFSDGFITQINIKTDNYMNGEIQVFTSTGTFTAPKTGKYKITVTGGGGSGGSYDITNSQSATGGGAGGTAIKYVTLNKGDSITVTCGVGGTAAGANASGNTGNTSSFGSYCSATGGSGGYVVSGVGVGTGGTGGTGSNGDINITGINGWFSLDSAYDRQVLLGNYGYTPTILGYGAGSKGYYYTQAVAGQDGVVIVEW